MLIVIEASLFLVLLFLYVYANKNMNLLEVFIYWFWTSILMEDYMNIIYTNLKLIENYKTLEIFWDTILSHLLLKPIALIWFLHFYIASKSIWIRLLLIVVMTLFLTSSQVIRELSGYIAYRHWPIWWCTLVWMIFVLSTVGLMRGLRWIKRREKQPI
jgi:hypothetical protein